MFLPVIAANHFIYDNMTTCASAIQPNPTWSIDGSNPPPTLCCVAIVSCLIFFSNFSVLSFDKIKIDNAAQWLAAVRKKARQVELCRNQPSTHSTCLSIRQDLLCTANLLDQNARARRRVVSSQTGFELCANLRWKEWRNSCSKAVHPCAALLGIRSAQKAGQEVAVRAENARRRCSWCEIYPADNVHCCRSRSN